MPGNPARTKKRLVAIDDIAGEIPFASMTACGAMASYPVSIAQQRYID